MARRTLLVNAERFLPGLSPSSVFSDIVELDYAALLDATGLAPGDANLMHGGPPCTPFSKSGYWLAHKRAGEDPKASLLDNYVDALRAIMPKAFLMENVYGLAYQNQNRPILNRFIGSVRSAGYSFDSRIILAADHGVPQVRQRLICVGVRDDLLDVAPELWRFSWPEETHTGPHEDESLTIGEVQLKITADCPRCVMTTLPQGDLPRDSGILRAAAQNNDAHVGVYAEVVRDGLTRRGDVAALS